MSKHSGPYCIKHETSEACDCIKQDESDLLQRGVMPYMGLTKEEDTRVRSLLKKKISDVTQEELAETNMLLLKSLEEMGKVMKGEA